MQCRQPTTHPTRAPVSAASPLKARGSGAGQRSCSLERAGERRRPTPVRPTGRFATLPRHVAIGQAARRSEWSCWRGRAAIPTRSGRAASIRRSCPRRDAPLSTASASPTVEINNTFYRMPAEAMLARWADEVPDASLRAQGAAADHAPAAPQRPSGDVAEFLRRAAVARRRSSGRSSSSCRRTSRRTCRGCGDFLGAAARRAGRRLRVPPPVLVRRRGLRGAARARRGALHRRHRRGRSPARRDGGLGLPAPAARRLRRRRPERLGEAHRGAAAGRAPTSSSSTRTRRPARNSPRASPSSGRRRGNRARHRGDVRQVRAPQGAAREGGRAPERAAGVLRQARVQGDAGAGARTRPRPVRAAPLRGPAARGAPPALRLPARGRRGAQVLGGPEGALAQSRRQAARGPHRGPSVRVRVLRGRDPGEAVRCRRGDRLGLRRVFARRGSRVLLPRSRGGRAAGSSPAWRKASSASSSAA